MWAYDEGRGRRAREVPSSRPGYYYDDAYERAPPRSSRALYDDPPAQPSSRDRHRRKSIHGDPDEPRSSRRNTHLVASDDESDYPPHGRSSREAYGSSYPDRTSRHDVEAKTSDRDRHFRDKRGSYENGEAENMRRAKSYSPRRAAREIEAEATQDPSPHASRAGWPEDDYAQPSGHHRSSKKNRAPKQYYEEDPRTAAYTTSQPPRSRTGDRGNTGYEYPPSAADMPRPPMGDQSPYKTPMASQPVPEERPSKHSRRREKDYYGNGYDDVPTNGAAAAAAAATAYDRGGYGSAADDPPPRRHHSRRHRDDVPRRGGGGGGDAGYPAQTTRGRHRSQPPQDDYEEDPYERVQRRPRHRQSMPPQARSRYPDDPYGDIYGQSQPPPRRATSVNHSKARRDQYYDDDAYGSKTAVAGGSRSRSGGGGGGGGSGKDRSGRNWQKQAGQLFMTHAVPVIKKEAVPFLTKAAQAYMEQQKRR